jgi:V/A-type H+-transporting ATPase subunit K
MLMSLGAIVSLILLVPAATTNPAGQVDTGLYILGAGLAAGLACLGAGFGLGTASAAAIGAVAEKPEMFSITFIYIVFIEAIAIYGLVIAFMILGKV